MTAPIELYLRAWADLGEARGETPPAEATAGAKRRSDGSQRKTNRRLRRARPGWRLRLGRRRNRTP